jgi:hypothetical protein
VSKQRLGCKQGKCFRQQRFLLLGSNDGTLSSRVISKRYLRLIMQKLKILPSIITALTALTLNSCSTATTEQYEATALTSYTWLVLYANDLTSQPQPRIET